jgi:hypothetical protein
VRRACAEDAFLRPGRVPSFDNAGSVHEGGIGTSPLNTQEVACACCVVCSHCTCCAS